MDTKHKNQTGWSHLYVVPPRTEAERFATAKYYFDAATMLMSNDPAIKAEGTRIIEELIARKQQARPPKLKVIRGGLPLAE